MTGRRAELWPADAFIGATDISIGGHPLSDLARSDGTPLIRIGVAVEAWPIPSAPPHLVTALVTTVEDVVSDEHGRIRELWVDAELDGCRPHLAEARLIGRRGSGRFADVAVRPGTPTAVDGDSAHLPVDVRPGDLLAIPCEGATALFDVRRRTSLCDRIDEPRDGLLESEGGMFRCLK